MSECIWMLWMEILGHLWVEMDQCIWQDAHVPGVSKQKCADYEWIPDGPYYSA